MPTFYSQKKKVHSQLVNILILLHVYNATLQIWTTQFTSLCVRRDLLNIKSAAMGSNQSAQVIKESDEEEEEEDNDERNINDKRNRS